MTDVVIFAIVIILMILAVKGSLKHFKGEGSCCQSSSPLSGQVSQKTVENVTIRKHLTVTGMHCTHCEDTVRAVLDGISGAAVSHIDWKKNLVMLDLNREVSDDLLRKIIEDKGYRLEKIENA